MLEDDDERWWSRRAGQMKWKRRRPRDMKRRRHRRHTSEATVSPSFVPTHCKISHHSSGGRLAQIVPSSPQLPPSSQSRMLFIFPSIIFK